MLKKNLQLLAHRFGYHISRKVGVDQLGEINVLQMAARELMSTSGRESLTFIQVGACDGMYVDPIHQLIRRFGWSGLLLEPQPTMFRKLVENYRGVPNVTPLNAALADKDGTATLYYVEPGPGIPDWVVGLASFNREVIAKHAESAPAIRAAIRPIEVPTVSVSTLVSQLGGKPLDILQVDTEGFDANAVTFFLEAGVTPPIINFEHAHVDDAGYSRLQERLHRLGYGMVKYGGGDTLAVRQAKLV